MDLSRFRPENYTFKSLSSFDGLFLRCGVCLRFLTVPPIHISTSTGVKICGRCFRADRYFRYQKDIDNAQLKHDALYEKFAALFIFPCSYPSCNKFVKFGESAEEHEETCEYKQYRCPISEANRWFLRYGDMECNMSFKEQHEMIEHVENNHIDYVLPGPCLHYRYIFLPFERRRLFILILDGKIVVLFSRKKDHSRCLLRCRTFPSESTDICEISLKDLQTGEFIKQRRIECGPLDGDEIDEVDQLFSISLDLLPPRTMFYFDIQTSARKPLEETEIHNDSDEEREDFANGYILL